MIGKEEPGYPCTSSVEQFIPSFNYLKNKGKLEKITDFEVLTVCFCNTFVFYLYFYEQDILPKGSQSNFETLS